MVIIPSNIEHRIHQRAPEIEGEEGFLFHEADLQSWVKRWNTAHEVGFGIPDRHQEMSALSPYWSKRMYYEFKLAHTLHPDLIMDARGAYDPRIRKEDSGNFSFDLTRGKPVTVSKEIDTSDPLAQEYNRIIRNLYNRTAPMFDKIRDGSSVGPNFRAEYDKFFDDADQELMGLLNAPEFLIFTTTQIQRFNSAADLENFYALLEQKVRRVNPSSPTLPLLASGVLPGHPLLNFIPRTDPDSQYQPAGTFVEIAVQAPWRVKRSIDYLTDSSDVKMATSEFNSFLVYQALDQFFYRMTIDILRDQRSAVFFEDPNVQNELYLFLENQKNKIIKRKITPSRFASELEKVYKSCLNCFTESSKVSKALKRLRALKDNIR